MTLSPDDQSLVTRDTGLPALGLVLDTQAMSELLARRKLGERTLLRRQYVRYQPGAHCIVKYETADCDDPTFLYAHAYGREHGSRLIKLKASLEQHQDRERRCWIDDEQTLAVHFFPSDGRLKTLYRLADSKRRRKLLSELLAGVQSDQSPQSLSYKPEKRYVCRIGDDHAGAVVKFYTAGGYRHARARSRCVRAAGIDYLPSNIGENGRHRALVFAWSDGHHLREYLASGGDTEAAVQAATRLEDLHRRPAPAAQPSWQVRDEIERVSRRVQSIAYIAPALAPKLRELEHRLGLAGQTGEIGFMPRAACRQRLEFRRRERRAQILALRQLTAALAQNTGVGERW